MPEAYMAWIKPYSSETLITDVHKEHHSFQILHLPADLNYSVPVL